MAVEQMFVCDNQACSKMAPPEDGSTKRKPITPYQWWDLVAGRQGTGPVVRITCCSLLCLQQTLEPAVNQPRQEM